MSFDQGKRRRTYALRFKTYPGLEISFRQPGFLALDWLREATLSLGDDLGGDGLSGDALLDAWRPLFDAVADSVVKWNLTDNGRAVPVSRILNQDWPFLLDIARVWYFAVVQRTDGIIAPEKPAASDSAADSPWPVQDADAPDDEPFGVDEEYLAQIPTQTLPAPVMAESPADRGVALSLDPDVAEAQEDAWNSAVEPPVPDGPAVDPEAAA